MTRFVVKLSNGLAQLIWAYTHKQANQAARNLAAYYSCKVLNIEEC